MADLKDALPEAKWLYRRIFTYVVTVVALILIAVCVSRAPDPTNIGLALCVLVGWMATLYLIAPASEHVAEILALSKMVRSRFGAGPTFPPQGEG